MFGVVKNVPSIVRIELLLYFQALWFCITKILGKKMPVEHGEENVQGL